jgi:hypothetical protein
MCTGDMLEQLVPHPAYKMTTVRSIPHVSDRSADYTTYQWPGLLRHLRQMLIASSPMEEGRFKRSCWLYENLPAANSCSRVHICFSLIACFEEK